MFSLDQIRGLLAEAERRSRWAGESAWLDWVAERGDQLVEAMGAWLDRLRAEPPEDAAPITERLLALWAAPGIARRPDIVQVASCFAATCPPTLGAADTASAGLPAALGRLLHARAGAPDVPIQVLLWHASLRPELSPVARLAFARFAFPLNASALRHRLEDPPPGDAPLAHQAWLLRFAEHPEFPATWGALFRGASAERRRALVAAAKTPSEQAAVRGALGALAEAIDDPAIVAAARALLDG